MSQRHIDALSIQEGACNPSAIARALVKACDEARADNKSVGDDPAVRLIVHQLTFLCGIDAINNEPMLYHELTVACEELSALT